VESQRKAVSRPVIYLVILCLVLALTLVAVSRSPSEPEPGANLADVDLAGLTILHMGGGDLATQLVDRLEAAGGRVIRSPDIPDPADLSPDVVAVFGGEWFEERALDPDLYDFLSLASSRGASMVMAGGITSVFFEALDRAGVYIMAVDETTFEARNPGHNNPPVVGHRMIEVGGHTGPSLLFSSGSSPDVLAKSVVKWLHEWTDRSLQSTASTSASPMRYVCEYNYWPLLDSDPHGRLNITAAVHKLIDDGVPNYDWYFYRIEVRSVPGTVAYDSAWRTDHTWAHHQVHNAGTDRWMGNYGPGTSSGADTVHVFLTPSGGPTGSVWCDPLDWSYSIDGVAVFAQRDYAQDSASWLHHAGRSAPMARDTQVSMPGFVVRTRQGYPSLVDAWYQVQFARRPLWWSIQTTGPSPTLMLDSSAAGH